MIRAVWASKPLVLAGLAAATAVLFWRPMEEPFMLPKVTLVVLAMVAVSAGVAIEAVVMRRLVLPARPVLVVAGGFLVALVMSTLASHDVVLSIVGARGRYTGLVPYVAYLTAFVVATAHRATRKDLIGLSWMLTAGAAAVSVYGFVQLAGADPFGWEDNDLPEVFSTFGNANFAGAFAGIVVVIAAAAGVSNWGHERRMAALGLGAMIASGAFTVATGTVQGPIAAAVGLAVLGTVIASNRKDESLRWISTHRLPSAALASTVVGVAVVSLWALSGRIADELAASFVERGDFWRTAMTIFREDPLTGSGLGTYGLMFPEHRPSGHAVNYGFLTADDPHSVPLAMLAQGGILLAIAYLAVVVYVGWSAVRGLRARSGQERVLFGGVVGAWVAYQVQSAVSIDEPPLALLHWVLAGVIVGGATPADQLREVRLPGLPARRVGRGRNQRLQIPKQSRVLAGMILVVALVAGAIVVRPARASLAAAHAGDLDRENRLADALDQLERATSLAPWETTYWDSKAGTLVALGKPVEALEAIEEAAERAPGNARYAILVGEGHAELGEEPAAVRWFREAASRDPNHPELLERAGKGLVAAGYEREGERLLERARRLEASAAR